MAAVCFEVDPLDVRAQEPCEEDAVLQKRLTGGPWIAALALTLLAPEPGGAQSGGAVEGTVRVELPAPRRSAGRYPGAVPAAHAVQQVPAVVYIEGPVAGARAVAGMPVPVMAQEDTAFVPTALAVEVGTTVRFPNQDGFFHNVFSYSAPARFDLGRYPRGDAKDVTFDEPGVVKVYCEVHEFMRAVIVVTENPYHAVADEGGRFRIQGVPAGTYTLVLWHPDLEPREQQITVSDGGTVRVEATLR
jgi:plastocyanin